MKKVVVPQKGRHIIKLETTDSGQYVAVCKYCHERQLVMTADPGLRDKLLRHMQKIHLENHAALIEEGVPPTDGKELPF